MGRKKKGSRARNHALAIVRKFFPDVTEVHDADEDSLIEVTANDSKVAKAKDHNDCAMAVACKRAFKARGVIISVGQAYIIKKEGAIRFSLPQSVSREIVSFDREAGFAEGTYKLSKPSGTHRLGAHVGAREWDRGAGNKRKPFKHFTSNIRVSLGALGRRG